MNKTLSALAVAAALAAASAQAQGFEQSNLYVGLGVSNNSISSSSATGFQGFAGYHFDHVDLGDVELAGEVGIMDSGNFNRRGGSATGLWGTAVFSVMASEQLRLLGRIGLDFGDDDGLMAGIGVGFLASPQVEVRGEYVSRDTINSVQVNLLYHF